MLRGHLTAVKHDEACTWKCCALLFTEVQTSGYLHKGLSLESKKKNEFFSPPTRTQMAARVCKNIIRALVREKMKQLKVPSSEPYRQLVLALFNLFSGYSKISNYFWTSNVPPLFDDSSPQGRRTVLEKTALDEEKTSDKSKEENDQDEEEILEGGIEYYIWKAVQFKAKKEGMSNTDSSLRTSDQEGDPSLTYEKLLQSDLGLLLPIKCAIGAKFGRTALTRQEWECKDRKEPFIFQGLFFKRLTDMLGIVMADTPDIFDVLNGYPPPPVPAPYEFMDPHLIELAVRSKNMHLMSSCEGMNHFCSLATK